ncbi:F-box/LRR-repeat protein 2 [Morella rubra]|uniref:F-box/LRR-repeat protein 2 n=1 Tax=Morella rubra TaxID=262757 RepID=A0A6A1W0J7_9ROSI|nr:F-box/LRR-repeat protein 2 [Morella rubra]
MSEITLGHLPEECWELIFGLIDHHRHFELLSSVCRQFLAISDRLRVSLTVSDRTIPFLPRLLRRFQHLKKIELGEFRGDLEGLLYQIAKSGLDIEALNLSNQKNLPLGGLRELGLNLKNLRTLNCSKIGFLQDLHLVVMATSFPNLEELDISYPEDNFSYPSGGLAEAESFKGAVTDLGVYAMSLRLKNLIKINLSGNHFITDQSLISLSSNCGLLREITVRDCACITQNAIGFAIRHNPELRSISIDEIGLPSIEVGFIESFLYANSLREIDLSNSFVPDGLLRSIAEASLSLNKLTLARCQGFTFSGMSVLMNKYQCLSLLNLEGVSFLTDQNILELSSFFSKITSINFSLCSKLTNSTLFTIIKKCHLLKEVNMERTNLGEEHITAEFVVNPRVKSLNLAQNGKLDDESIKKLVAVCPNLQLLNLSLCLKITGESISEIFKRCDEIKHLEINHCSGIKEFVIDSELCKLEELNAEGSGIKDDALSVVGKRSCRLLHLDLAGCLNVTAKGVKEVVEKCRGLREINLQRCDSVNVDIVARMVFSRPSLRKIIPPCGFVPTKAKGTSSCVMAILFVMASILKNMETQFICE